MTMFKGGFEIAQETFLSVSLNGATNNVDWEIPIDKNMTRFNKSDEPQIQVQFSHPGTNDPFTGCAFFYCGGFFRMYYHTPGNDTAEIEFPIENQTMPMEEEDDGGLIGGVTDSVPGFGLLAGVGSLAMAAVAASRFSRQD